MRDLTGRHRLAVFFALALAISWSVWAPMAVRTMSGRAAPVGSPLNALAVWSPAIAAVIALLVAREKGGIDRLFAKLKRWDASPGWYLAALLYPAAIWCTAFGIDRLMGRSYPATFLAFAHLFKPEQSYMVVVALVFVLPNTLGEELGWRGFALPELLRVRGPLTASLVLGILWAVWHLPMWLMYGKTGLPLAASVVWTVAIAVIFTRIYIGSGNRLPLAWLFHASLTATGYLLSSIPTYTDEMLHLAVAVIAGIALALAHRAPRITAERQRTPGDQQPTEEHS